MSLVSYVALLVVKRHPQTVEGDSHRKHGAGSIGRLNVTVGEQDAHSSCAGNYGLWEGSLTDN